MADTTTTITVAEILAAIQMGAVDGDLGRIARTAQHRQKIVARSASVTTMKPGSKVTIIAGQKYLQGASARVVEFTRTGKVLICLLENRGRFAAGAELTATVEMLAVADAA